MTRPHVSTLPAWWDGSASGALARGTTRSEARTRAVPARSAGLDLKRARFGSVLPVLPVLRSARGVHPDVPSAAI
jgi:hypothetical protein